jgi:uncharacterized protein YdaU (DUF1376 family)
MSDLRPLPYYKWFWQDWRANRKAQRMSYIERGLYRELLDECWVEGFIPNDISILAEICGCPDEVMADAWQVLESCFELVDDKYINKKMESMRTEKDSERLTKSQSGKKGGDSKSLNFKPKKAIAKQVLASAKQVLALPNIEEKRREEYTGAFELFWEQYPRHENKSVAMKSWKKVDVELDVILKAIEKHKQTKQWKDGVYPHASTWLNQRRWEDELTATTSERVNFI